MSLKLNSSGGGSITLQEPSTASNRTLTLPDNTGNLISSADSGTVAPAMLSTGAPSWDSSGNLSFNSGYGSVATAYGCRAWVNFNGNGTIAIRGSGGVSSLTDDGTGKYRVNFSVTMPDTNYCGTGSATDSTTFGDRQVSIVALNTTYATVLSGQTASTNMYDSGHINVAIFR